MTKEKNCCRNIKNLSRGSILRFKTIEIFALEENKKIASDLVKPIDSLKYFRSHLSYKMKYEKRKYVLNLFSHFLRILDHLTTK